MAVVPKQSGRMVLKKLIPLNTLSDDALDRLLPETRFQKWRKGEYLFRKGDIGQHKIYLLSGQVGLMNGPAEVDVVVGGSNLAKFPVAHKIPREFSAVAKTKCELVLIDNKLLDQLLNEVEYSISDEGDSKAESAIDWMGQLLQSRIFQRIPPASIQSVMMRMEAVEVEAGQQITCQGDTGDYFYLINQGSCLVSRVTEEGKTEALAELAPGDCFGEEALLSDRPRGGTVTMLENGVLLQLGREDFTNYVKSSLSPLVDYPEAQELVEDGSVWLDVRNPDLYESEHIAGSINIPLNSLRSELDKLTHDMTYIVCCQDGQISTTAAFLLIGEGIDVVVLRNGLEGLPEDVINQQVENVRNADPAAEELEELKALRAERDQALQRISQLTEERDQLNRQLREAAQRIAILEARYADSDTVDGPRNSSDDQAPDSIIQALDQVQGERDDLKEQLEIAGEQIRSLEKQQREQGRKGSDTDSENAGSGVLQAELATLSAALDESYGDFERVLERAEQAENERDRLREELGLVMAGGAATKKTDRFRPQGSS